MKRKKRYTMIRVEENTQKLLDKEKIHPNQSYNEVILIIIKALKDLKRK